MFNKLSRLKIKGDGIIWMVFFLLCIVSVLEVYSASSSLTYKAGNYWNPVLYHTILLFFGVGFMIVTMNIKCKYFKIVTPFALVISLVMLIAVLIVGQSTNGAQRWIGLFGIQFQPSEIAKGAVILAEAQILSAMQTIDGADRRAFKYILFVSLPIIFLIAMENLSTAALLFLTVIIMMFIGRVPKVQLGRLMGVLALLAASGFAMIMLVGNDAKEPTDSEKMNMTEQVVEKKEAPGFMAKIFHRADTWKARIVDFMDHTELSPEEVDLDKDAQKSHAKIAIASSNIVGKGPGNSVEHHHRRDGYRGGSCSLSAIYHPVVPHGFHRQPLCQRVPRTADHGYSPVAGNAGYVQYGRGRRTGACYRTAATAHQQGWNVNHRELCLCGNHPER